MEFLQGQSTETAVAVAVAVVAVAAGAAFLLLLLRSSKKPKGMHPRDLSSLDDAAASTATDHCDTPTLI